MPTTSSQTHAWMLASGGKMFGCGMDNARIICEALSKRGVSFIDNALIRRFGDDSREVNAEVESVLNAAIRTRSFDLATAMIERGADPSIGSAHLIGSNRTSTSPISPYATTLDNAERDARRPG